MPDDAKTHSRIAADYFHEVGTYEVPTKEEEKRLFTAYKKLAQQEQAATNAAVKSELKKQRVEVGKQIACGYLRFVVKRARERTRDEMLLRELISEGHLGLMIGIERFDVDRGFRFLTYAGNWINVYMQEHLNRLGHVHVPNHTRKEIRRRRASEEKLMSLGVLSQHSIEEPTVGPLEPGLHPGSENTEDPAMAAECNMLHYLVLAGLNRCERLILIHYFGLRNGSPKTFGDLAQLLYEIDGSVVPSEQVRQIKDRAVVRLKTYLESKGIQQLNDLL